MKKDMLNRNKFIKMIVDFVQILSEGKRECCFAIDGRWGTGKTFVLDLIETELRNIQSEKTSDNQFWVFHYNCWQYDYYEEPAIAIVSAMLNAIEDEKSFLGREVDGKLKTSYDIAKEEIKKMAGKFAENHIGINVVEVWDRINDVEDKEEKQKNKYDTLFGFKQVLEEVRKSLKLLAKEKTLVFVVDELDRCIPAYAIKVLERLHHLFDEVENTIVLISVDSIQLEHSIKKIYGEKTVVKEYLKKFIDMTFSLDTGEIQCGVLDKYASFFSMFENPQESDVQEIETLFLSIWENVDMRTQEKMMERAETIHRLVMKEPMNLAVALAEIIIVRFQDTYAGKNLYWIPKINKSTYGGLEEAISKKTTNYLKDLQKQACNGRRIEGGTNSGKSQLRNNLLGNIFWFLSNAYNANDVFCSEAREEYIEEIKCIEAFKEIANVLE